eukprot:TRINITY_DN41888_c0_g1_i1.p1 TRINITY_DN41888_c0_g1~~TRINITY_DN41888_c0_g1_i1.p1  ORF type:complete len:393 (-),score=85.06 TRINITY_DN41888_c0_g1_i1:165-1343(-)
MAIAVKVTGISRKATLQDIYDFFSFSGPITSIHAENDADADTQTAHVAFTEQKSLDTALLLTGAMIVDQVVVVEPIVDYQPPSDAKLYSTSSDQGAADGVTPAATPIKKAEEMMRSLLSRGYVLGQDAMQRARDFDERIEFSRTAAAGTAAIRDGIVALPGTITAGAKALPGTISAGAMALPGTISAGASTITAGAMALPTTISAGAKALGENVAATAATIDKKLYISQSFNAGTAGFARSISTVDEKLQISEKTKGAFLAAEAKLSEAGEVLGQNKLIASSKEWVMGVTSKIGNYVEGERSELTAAELEAVKAAAASEKIVPTSESEEAGEGIASDDKSATQEADKPEGGNLPDSQDIKTEDKAAEVAKPEPETDAAPPAVKPKEDDAPVF